MRLPDPESQPNYRGDDEDEDNITEERAARRFHQIRRIEKAVAKIDKHLAVAKDKVAVLKEEREGLVATLMAAARDEGELPLFADL